LCSLPCFNFICLSDNSLSTLEGSIWLDSLD
jgi:hypothetical protein